MPVLLVMDVLSVFQADLPDRLPPLQLLPAAGVSAGVFLGGGVPAVVAGVGGGEVGDIEGHAELVVGPSGAGGPTGGGGIYLLLLGVGPVGGGHLQVDPLLLD